MDELDYVASEVVDEVAQSVVHDEELDVIEVEMVEKQTLLDVHEAVVDDEGDELVMVHEVRVDVV